MQIRASLSNERGYPSLAVAILSSGRSSGYIVVEREEELEEESCRRLLADGEMRRGTIETPTPLAVSRSPSADT